VSLALHLPKTESGDFVTNLKRVDFGGAAFLILSVFFLLIALDRGGNISWNDRYTISALVAFGVCFMVFAFVEMEFASEPFAPKRIVINRSLIASYLINFFGTASMFSMIFYIPLYFQVVQGRSATDASLWLVIPVFGGMSGSIGGGLIIQATGKFYTLTVLGYLALFAGTMLVTLTSGIVVVSSIGIAMGKSVEL
jgi:predicted MFS family arabinose efflux permease